jgi:hypothetical protein
MKELPLEGEHDEFWGYLPLAGGADCWTPPMCMSWWITSQRKVVQQKQRKKIQKKQKPSSIVKKQFGGDVFSFL